MLNAIGRAKYRMNLSDVDDSDDEDLPPPRFQDDSPPRQTKLLDDLSPTKEPEVKPLRDLEDGNAKDKKKKAIRAPIPKLDAEVLLSEKGLPKLKKKLPTLKLKGKGHEFDDLQRIMENYQLWSHDLFPRLTFDAFIDRAEKVCRERRVKVHLEQWRRDRLRKQEDPDFEEQDMPFQRNPFDSHSDDDDDDRRRGGMAGADDDGNNGLGFDLFPTATAIDAEALKKIEENRRAAMARLEEKNREKERLRALLAEQEAAEREMEMELQDEAALEAEREWDAQERRAPPVASAAPAPVPTAEDDFGLDDFEMADVDLDAMEAEAIASSAKPAEDVTSTAPEAVMRAEEEPPAEEQRELEAPAPITEDVEVAEQEKEKEETGLASIPPPPPSAPVQVDEYQMDEADLAAALFADDDDLDL